MAEPVNLPDIQTLKEQAKRLREELARQGTNISHSAALERISKAMGYRDWNTLSAASRSAMANVPRTGCPVAIGEEVSGRYLHQPFHGVVHDITTVSPHAFHVTIKLDEAIDVVSFDSFSSFRSRLTGTIGSDGKTAAKTSDGRPHLELAI